MFHFIIYEVTLSDGANVQYKNYPRYLLQRPVLITAIAIRSGGGRQLNITKKITFKLLRKFVIVILAAPILQ